MEHEDIAIDYSSTVKRGLLLLGSFAIAYNLAVLLHELCHLLVACLTGGRCNGIYINPFSWSYSSSSSSYSLLHTMAGPFGAVVFGLILFVLIWRWYRPFLLPLFAIAPIALFYNALYLLVDIFMRSGGDGFSMVRKGMPSVLVVIASIGLLLMGLWSFVLFSRKTGLFSADFKGRLIILSLGVLPYLAAIVAWNYFYNRFELMLWLVYAGCGTVLCVIVAAIPLYCRASNSSKPLMLRWPGVIVVNVLAVGFIVFLLVGPLSERNLSGTKIYSKRPDDFPEVLRTPSFAINASYASSPYISSLLTYGFPETTAIEEVQDYIRKQYEGNGYVLLLHNLEAPDEIGSNGWVEINEGKNTVDAYLQFWLKTDPEVCLIKIAITRVRENGKYNFARVKQGLPANLPREKILTYVSEHPEEFSDEQLEKINSLRDEGP